MTIGAGISTRIRYAELMSTRTGPANGNRGLVGAAFYHPGIRRNRPGKSIAGTHGAIKGGGGIGHRLVGTSRRPAGCGNA